MHVSALDMQTSRINWFRSFFFTLLLRCAVGVRRFLVRLSVLVAFLVNTYIAVQLGRTTAFQILSISSVSLPQDRCALPCASYCELVLAPVHLPLFISLFIPQPARFPFRSDLITL